MEENVLGGLTVNNIGEGTTTVDAATFTTTADITIGTTTFATLDNATASWSDPTAELTKKVDALQKDVTRILLMLETQLSGKDLDILENDLQL